MCKLQQHSKISCKLWPIVIEYQNVMFNWKLITDAGQTASLLTRFLAFVSGQTRCSARDGGLRNSQPGSLDRGSLSRGKKQVRDFSTGNVEHMCIWENLGIHMCREKSHDNKSRGMGEISVFASCNFLPHFWMRCQRFKDFSPHHDIMWSHSWFLT